MKPFFFILFFSSAFLYSQKKIQLVFGAAINTGLERINSEDKDLGVEKTAVAGHYISLGCNFKLDSIYLLYAGIRYGRENSRFKIEEQNQTLEFRTNNRPLSFIFAPGLRINKHNALFLNLGVVRVLHTNRGGGGGGERGGKPYFYSYADNLPRNSWELRPGLKWQLIPRAEKKLAFEFGLEPSLLTRNLEMEIKNSNSFLPSRFINLRYDLILFYLGIQF